MARTLYDRLGGTLDKFKVPASDKAKVLGAFAAHKNEVTMGHRGGNKTAGGQRKRTIAEGA